MPKVALPLAVALVLPVLSSAAVSAVAPAADAAHLAKLGTEVADVDSTPLVPMHLQPCVGGMAGGVYPCSNIDLMEFISHATFTPASGSVKTNSLWGWTDPMTNREYVLLGLNNGTAFIDITDPEEAIYLGKLPSHSTIVSTWRDVREYANHAYIVVDNGGAHGMQIFDLTQLRNVVNPPVTFSETAHYSGVTNVHTISITKETGRVYLAGSSACGGNLQILSVAPGIPAGASPTTPVVLGCYNDDPPASNYVHENQCFIYHGPDVAHTGKEICLAARGSAHALDVLDATNGAAPVRLSRLVYNASGYSHQAWFTEDHRYILLNDELDEDNVGHNTRTWIFDAADLDAVVPAGTGYFEHDTPAIDHNLYVRGNFVFQSNYRAGLRVLQLTNLATASLTEVAYFDVYPANDDPAFNGTWNNYPFFASGVIPVSHIEQGLFLLKPTNLCSPPAAPAGLTATANGANRIDLDWTGSGAPGAEYVVERALGGCSGEFEAIASELTASDFDDLTASGTVTYGYRVRETTGDALCASPASSCVTASTSGACTAPPAFAGIESAASPGSAACAVALDWSAADDSCGGPVTYSVYRGTNDSFVPSPANRIAQGLTGTAYVDLGAAPGAPSHYVVRSVDAANGVEDHNLVRRFAQAVGPLGDGTFTTGAEIGHPDLDTGDALAALTPQHAGWHISTTRAQAGSRSFWSTDSNNMCVTLEGTFDLTPAQISTLSFQSAWDIENGWDGGVLDISTNGGANWTRLTPSPNYPGTITDGGTLCGIAVGQGAFTGDDATPTFAPYTVNLAAYAGQEVRLRWLYRTDAGTTGEGWYIDAVSLTHTQLPGACAPNGLFVDGFESANTAAWSSVAP